MRVPPWGLLIVLLLGVFIGWKTNGWRLEGQINAAKATQVTKTLTTERKDNQNAHSADAAPAAAQQSQQEKARVITKEVIRYVQSPVAGQCALPAEWVRIHDAAARVSADPSTTGLPAAPASADAGTVTDSEALGTITANYDTCNQEINRVSGWQIWWNSLRPRQ